MHLPLLRSNPRKVLVLAGDGALTLTGLRILHKGTVLLVELTQDAKGSPVLNDTTALATTASVTRAFPSGFDAGKAGPCDGRDGGDRGDRRDRRCYGGFELDRVLLSRQPTTRLRTSSGDSNGAVVVGSRHRRLDCYCHGHGIGE
jgi:hypothetical protein